MSQLVQLRWDRKLQNWALWIVGQSNASTGGPSREWWDAPPRPPQPLVGEALDTDALITRLSYERKDGDPSYGANLYEAIRAWYVWTGNIGERAAALKIHHDTLHDRVRAARYRLEDLDQIRRRDATRPPNMLAYA